MESVKDIIAANLVELRKSHKYTQQQLAEKLNYSDKAISRWEHGETLPDIETLCKVCEIYGVKFEYLLQKEQPKRNNPYIVKTNRLSRMLVLFISVCTVWIFATVAFSYVDLAFGYNAWVIFIWAVPLSCIVAEICNSVFFKNKALKCVLFSIITWSLILSLYLQLLEHNLWMLFITGVPLQAVIILTTVLRYKSPDYSFVSKKEDNK